MTSSGASSVNNYADKINFIRMRRQGFSAEALLNTRNEENLEQLQQNIAQISDELLSRQEEANRQIADLSGKVISILNVDAQNEQALASNKEFEELQRVEKELSELPPQVLSELSEQGEHKEELISTLEALRQKLKATTALHKFIYQIGEKISHHEANGGPQRVDVEREKRLADLKINFNNFES